METMDSGSRHRSALATLNRLDMETVHRDGLDAHHKLPTSALTITTAPLPSPTATYPGPPVPYSCSSSVTPSNMGNFDYISPPSSRRTTVDDKVSSVRQSLPSIKEALGGDGSMPFLASNMVHPLSTTSRISQQTSSFGTGQSLPEAPLGPSNPFSHASVAGPTLENEPFTSRVGKGQEALPEQERMKSAFPSINTTEPLPPSSQTMDVKSPKPRSTHPTSSHPYSQSPHTNSYQLPSNTSPNRFPPYRSPYTYSAESSNPPSSTFTTAPDYSRFNPAFKFDDRKQTIPRSHPVQPYCDSVKRHLEIFDIDMALNEVYEGSNRVVEFSSTWRQHAHQRQRTGQLPDSLPSLPEVEDLMRQSSRVVEAMGRIKEAVIAQQHALAEEQARALKRDHYEDELTGFSGEFKENGVFAAGDSKKRRGKAAPPGRCHSCNRAETPEWRRGPDGARTLCNACGLHYAKLTRKMAVNKNAAHSGSNLRPKNSEAHSAM